jgi:hypothetical protein
MREMNTAASEEGRSSPERREEAVKEHEGTDIRLYLEMGKRTDHCRSGRYQHIE